MQTSVELDNDKLSSVTTDRCTYGEMQCNVLEQKQYLSAADTRFTCVQIRVAA